MMMLFHFLLISEKIRRVNFQSLMNLKEEASLKKERMFSGVIFMFSNFSTVT